MRERWRRRTTEIGIEKPKPWWPRGWALGFRIVAYLGAAVFLLWLARAVFVVFVRREPWDVPWGFNPDAGCTGISSSCGALIGFLLPWLTLAFATFLFFINRFWTVPRARKKTARETPHKVVPTAGSIIGKVVGRDELCKVIVDSVRTTEDRRPQLIVGGVGTGKTAVMVQLTQLLARYRATPVAIRVRDVDKDFSFQKAASQEFKRQINARVFSDAEADKVWRYLSYDDRIVVLADGLEEAFTENKDRDDLIRLAIAQARRDHLPLVIASRPHDSLRGMDTSALELEPLSEEAALQYLGSSSPLSDLRRIDWIVETAGVTEAPLYLRIAHELSRERMLSHLVADDDDAGSTVNTRDLDRSALRRNLLDTWTHALTHGRLHGESPLTSVHRQATVVFIAALACVGLQKDQLEVKYADALWSEQPQPTDTATASGSTAQAAAADPRQPRKGKPGQRPPHTATSSEPAEEAAAADRSGTEWETDRFANKGLTDWVRERHRSLREPKDPGGNTNKRLAATVNTRIAATWGAQLGLVDVRGEAVRFQHSVLQAYLGSLPLEGLLGEKAFLDDAFRWPDRPGRELLIAMVLLSRQEASRHLPEELAGRPPATSSSENRTAANLVRTLHERMTERFTNGYDSKGLDMLAAALEIGTVAPARDRRLRELADLAAKDWALFSGADPRNLEEAKLGLVGRFGDALREIDRRGRRIARGERYPEQGDVEEAYRNLFQIGYAEEFSYPVRHAVAQELGAGGRTAFCALEREFRCALEGLNTDDGLRSEEDWRKTVMSAALAPLLLVGSGRREADWAAEVGEFTPAYNLARWMGRVGRPEVRDRGRTSESRAAARPEDQMRPGAGAADPPGEDARRPAESQQVDPGPDASRPQDQQAPGVRTGPRPRVGDIWRGTHRQLPLPLLPISVEVALAKGFKYAANRRARHSLVRAEARIHLAEQAMELLRRSGFWFSQLTLLQALGLWALPDEVDDEAVRVPGPASRGVDGRDIRARVHHWVDLAGTLRDTGREPHHEGIPPRPTGSLWRPASWSSWRWRAVDRSASCGLTSTGSPRRSAPVRSTEPRSASTSSGSRRRSAGAPCTRVLSSWSATCCS